MRAVLSSILPVLVTLVAASPLESRDTCTTTPKHPYPPSLTCGATGSVARGASLSSTNLGAGSTLNQCRDSCISAGSSCVSFSYASDTFDCELYTKQVVKMGFTPDSTSTVTFFNRKCFYVMCSYDPPTTTTTTTTAAPTTTSSTSTTDPTSTAPLPTPFTGCGNAGLGWAIYINNYGDAQGGGDASYPNFDPTGIKQEPNLFAGVTNITDLHYFGDPYDQQTIYDSNRTFIMLSFVLNHAGYVYAPVSGQYNFAVTNSDDLVLAWFGSYAFAGYTRSNAYMDITHYGGGGTGQMSVTLDLVGGTYYPIRVMYAQAQGVVDFGVTLTAPDGSMILGSTPSPYVVQYDCNRPYSPFPPFYPFSSEV